MTKPKTLLVPIYWLLAIGAVAAAILYTEKLVVVPPIALLLEDGRLTDAQSTAIGYIPELGQLMINWCVALLGAIAVSIRSVLGWSGINRLVFGGTLALSFLACVISIWLGMVVLDLLILLLSLEQDPLFNDTLRLCRMWQYISFVIALVFFAFSWLSVATYAVSQSETGKEPSKQKGSS